MARKEVGKKLLLACDMVNGMTYIGVKKPILAGEDFIELDNVVIVPTIGHYNIVAGDKSPIGLTSMVDIFSRYSFAYNWVRRSDKNKSLRSQYLRKSHIVAQWVLK